MGRYLSLPLLLIAALIQSTVVPEIRIGDSGPDVVLLCVLSWMLLAGMDEGIFWAVVGGIFQDLMSGTPPGTTSLALVLVSGAVNLLIGQVARGNIVFPPLVAAAGTALYHILLIVLFTVIGRPAAIGYTLIYVTLPSALFNMALALPIFRLMGWVYARSRPRRVTM